MNATPTNDPLHERFVRWQQITREQLALAINMFLGFAGATVGFEISLLTEHGFDLPSPYQKLAYLGSIMLLAMSILFGVFAVLFRLKDFRLTTQTVKLEWQSPSNTSEISKLRAHTKRLGERTWIAFGGQIFLFSLGVILAASVFLTFAAQTLKDFWPWH